MRRDYEGRNTEAFMTPFLQTPHPVIPLISDEMILRMPAEAVLRMHEDRELAIQTEKEDKFNGTFDLPMWKRVDLEVALRRLEVGGHPVLQVVILGGIRSSKSHFAARRLAQHLIHGMNPWVWALHETEDSSKTIGQKWVHHYLPNAYKTESGKAKGAGTSLNYVPGKGFTGSQCVIGRKVCEFRLYGSSYSSKQGAELSMAWGDELVPPDVAETLRERVLTRAKDMLTPEMMHKVREAVAHLEAGRQCPGELLAAVYHGVVLLTFTPKEGYSPMVAEVLDGAITLPGDERPAPLLPIKGQDGKIAGYKLVPTMKRAKKRTTIVAYFHTDGNPYGNYAGLVEELTGASEAKVLIDAYGDVRKSWNTCFPKFRDSVHVISASAVPRAGTFYHRVDPCDTRNFFMSWWKVFGKRHYCVREWPQEGDYIPGVGDPGPWAVSSKKGKFDGDPGPAQENFGFGLQDYAEEILRVERELAVQTYGESAKRDAQGEVIPIEVFERHMDSRFGNAATTTKDESTTLIEQFEELGLDFIPAPGEHLKEGIDLINNALAYKEDEEISAINCPKLAIVDTCGAMIWSFQNWTNKDGLKGAGKDPPDTARYHFLADPEDMEGEPLMVKRGRGVY